jgi:hypothetical protein
VPAGRGLRAAACSCHCQVRGTASRPVVWERWTLPPNGRLHHRHHRGRRSTLTRHARHRARCSRGAAAADRRRHGPRRRTGAGGRGGGCRRGARAGGVRPGCAFAGAAGRRGGAGSRFSVWGGVCWQATGSVPRCPAGGRGDAASAELRGGADARGCFELRVLMCIRQPRSSAREHGTLCGCWVHRDGLLENGEPPLVSVQFPVATDRRFLRAVRLHLF